MILDFRMWRNVDAKDKCQVAPDELLIEQIDSDDITMMIRP